jgi:hypothetical protein
MTEYEKGYKQGYENCENWILQASLMRFFFTSSNGRKFAKND